MLCAIEVVARTSAKAKTTSQAVLIQGAIIDRILLKNAGCKE
jgi:hypothetical protein